MKRSLASTSGSRKSAKSNTGQTAGRQSRVQRASAPLATSSSTNSSKVREIRLPNGNRQLTFCEYVQDIPGSVAFAVSKYPVQPGIATLFAWLAGQAQYYNEYRFKALSFRYETEKAATLSGKVMFAFNPDAADLQPFSKQEMLQFENKAADVLWQPFRLGLPARLLGDRDELYIRTGTLAANLDIKSYDLGNLWVATEGMADTSAVGELYVEYTVELISPLVNMDQLLLSQSASWDTTAGVTDAAIFGTAPSKLGGLDIVAVNNTMTFNRVGQYLIAMLFSGTGLFTAFQPALTGTASSADVINGVSNAAANAGTEAVVYATVWITARGQTVIFSGVAAAATTVTQVQANVALFQIDIVA